MKITRIIAAMVFFVAGIWCGAFAEAQLPVFHWARFPALLTGIAFAVTSAAVIGYGALDAAFRLPAALWHAVMGFIFGEANAGPYRVISLRSGNEVARFITASDAIDWAASRRRMEGPHGPAYEVRDRADNVVGSLRPAGNALA